MSTPDPHGASPTDMIEIDGVVFVLETHQGTRGSGEQITLKKPRWMLDRYRELAADFHGAAMVEVGLWDGGSTAFLASVFEPSKLVGFELAERPLEALDRFLERRGLTDRVHVHLGVDQADIGRLTAAVDEHCDGPLDVVIDDASHQLGPTAATFDCLFPRLRPGGLYVIEDWSHEHQLAHGIRQALASGRVTRADLGLDDAAPGPVNPLSRLIVDALLATAHGDGVIDDVRVRQGLAEIRRGTAPIDPEFSIREHIGEIGRAVSPRPGADEGFE